MGLAVCIGNPVERRLGLLSHGYVLQGILAWNIWNRNNQYNFCTLVVFQTTIPSTLPELRAGFVRDLPTSGTQSRGPSTRLFVGFPMVHPKSRPKFRPQKPGLEVPNFSPVPSCTWWFPPNTFTQQNRKMAPSFGWSTPPKVQRKDSGWLQHRTGAG